jgi:hypothetical protein
MANRKLRQMLIVFAGLACGSLSAAALHQVAPAPIAR